MRAGTRRRSDATRVVAGDARGGSPAPGMPARPGARRDRDRRRPTGEDADAVFAATAAGHLFRSDDGVRTFAALGDGLPKLHRIRDRRYRTKIGAVTGEGFGGGPFSDAIKADMSVMVKAATEYADDDPAVVVLALGTNVAWKPELSLDAAESAMADMIAYFRNSCIVGVEISEWSDAENYDRNEARELNAWLRRLADVAVPALEPSDVGDDQIHPRPAGRKVFAEAMASAARECPTEQS
jgi:hypothetical protein